jgi:pimeloyl-ACP methyl ester carboxylesterase
MKALISKEAPMATYLPVPGAFSGGWMWKPIARMLRAAGHEVYTPTPTGLGERKHLLTPDVDLDTHVTDIVNVLEFEDLHDVILVGGSYSGMIVTCVAEQAAERLAHIVYLDAFVPEDGESLASICGPEVMEPIERQAREHGDGWRWPRPPHLSHFHTDHPLKTLYGVARLRSPEAAALPRTFVYLTVKDDAWPFKATLLRIADRARSRGWRYRELPTHHRAHETMPRELTDLLLEVAALRV